MASKPFTPHPYQLDIIDFITSNARCAVWAGMGSGKSVSTLTALEHLSLVEEVYPALVLAPLRVARTTWPDEVAKWVHTEHLRIVPVTGNVKQRLTSLTKAADVYTTNYEQLPWLVEHYGDKWPFKTVVADEQTRLKSYRTRQGSKRAKALAQVAHTKVSRFIGLTGTPSPNGLADLWGQTWFVDRGERLGRTYSAFEARWFSKGWDGFSVSPLPTAQKEIEGRLKDVCLTVTGLPVDEPIVNNIYVELPSDARDTYDDMEKEMFMEIEEFGVEALNAAAKTMKCLDGDTDVLTDRGWVPLRLCTARDRLWDGIEWVNSLGLVCQGYKPVVDCWGVNMTSDHKVLTSGGWRTAQEILDAEPSQRPHRKEYRLPDDLEKMRVAEHSRNKRSGHMVGALRMWKRVRASWRDIEEPQAGHFHVVRVQTQRGVVGRTGYSRHDGDAAVDHMAEHAIPLRKPERQGLAELRCQRNYSLRRMAKVVCSLLGRHGVNLPVWADPGANRREPRLRPGKLQMGLPARTGKQHPFQRAHNDALGRNDGGRGGEESWGKERHSVSAHSIGLARTSTARGPDTLVYDLVNAGPRHRFMVRGTTGLTFIVHNCLQIASGAAYIDDKKNWREVHDEKIEALRSVVEEAAGAPVLVAYHFKSDLARLQAAFPKARTLDADPATIHQWNEGRIPLLLAHPASAGHGLNLARGGNILAFFSLNWSLENYMQIIERIGPMRQKQEGLDRPVFVHHIMARDTVDDMVLERLASKRDVQDILLEAMQRRKKVA